MVHRRYVPYSRHYAGNLVDGAYSLGLFGDVATEMCIVTDGDEGLFASYSERVGSSLPCAPATSRDLLRDHPGRSRSREMTFAAHVVAHRHRRGTRRGEAAAQPILATSRRAPSWCQGSRRADPPQRFCEFCPTRGGADLHSHVFAQVRMRLTARPPHERTCAGSPLQIVVGGPASGGHAGGWGANHSSDAVRGGRSAP